MLFFFEIENKINQNKSFLLYFKYKRRFKIKAKLKIIQFKKKCKKTNFDINPPFYFHLKQLQSLSIKFALIKQRNHLNIPKNDNQSRFIVFFFIY